MRKRRESRIMELPFADVAMAVMGPIAFLMILFMLFTGSMAQRPICDTPEGFRLQILSQKLQKWVETTRSEVKARENYIKERCYISKPPVTDNIKDVPEPLRDICPRDRAVVHKEAGVTETEIEALLQNRQTIATWLTLCVREIPDTACRELQSDELSELQPTLREWMNGLRDQINSWKALSSKIDCPMLVTASAKPADVLILPDRLKSFCRPDLERLFVSMGMSTKELQQLLGEKNELSSRLTDCIKSLDGKGLLVPKLDEVPEPKKKQLEFKSCSTEFDPKPGKSLSNKEMKSFIWGFFDGLAAELTPQLTTYTYNRIDIFGHSDSRPIQRKCDNGAQDNEQLSALRVLVFRKELVAAFERNNHSGVAKLLREGSLRIYAIGVGAMEPINEVPPTETDDEKHRINRRIELRLVKDQYVKKK